MKDLVIIGAGGFGRETAFLVEEINSVKNQWNLLGYIDDNPNIQGKVINSISVIGNLEWLNSYKNELYIVVAIGDPKLKKLIVERICNENLHFATLIHPNAIISKSSYIGMNVIIQANCIISTNVEVLDHVSINPQCGIGHDSIINSYSSLFWNVNISGNVNVEEGTLLGTKATVLQGLKLGEWSTIGAGAVVNREVFSNNTVVGVPAKPVKCS